ncbi:hypothetical protein M3Y99_01530700 [Aphelenchoides fujianensis]|nr:hypothetical protein M3Y99_01530700 [Aphelenchoides fujianensis]
MDPAEQPSTSTAPDQPNGALTDEEIAKDAKRLDSRLENCAKKFNLTSMNVKNILFHIFKDPRTLAALLTDDPNASETLRLTRSRLKQLEETTKTKLNIELKPVNTTANRRTFLDVDYGENDEDDADYQPEEVEDEQEADREELGEFTEEDRELTEADDSDLFGPDVELELQRHLGDDPEYFEWVNACLKTDTTSADEQDADDEDYLFQDSDLPDPFEFRMDRSTEISRRELRGLYDDIVEGGADLVDAPKVKKPKQRPPTPDCSLLNIPMGDSITPVKQRGNAAIVRRQSKDPADAPSSPVKPAEKAAASEEPTASAEIQQEKAEEKPAGPQSWSLLKRHQEPARFTDDELIALTVQLEKHVQLLTQFIVTTTDNPELRSMRNQALVMIHELDKKMYEKEDQLSIFYIRTLPDAVCSCHAVDSFKEADGPEWSSTEAKVDIEQAGFSYKSAIVLAQSGAVVYPELLLACRPAVHPTFSAPFSVSEQMLLSLALFELHHVPHATGGVGRAVISKYQTVSTYFLPNKTANQIRNHLKNVRAGTLASPLHQLIILAERGKFNAVVSLDRGTTARAELPIDWPSDVSGPRWLEVAKRHKAAADANQTTFSVDHAANSTVDLNSSVPSIQVDEQPGTSTPISLQFTAQMVSPSSAVVSIPSSALSLVQMPDGSVQLFQSPVATPSTPLSTYQIVNLPEQTAGSQPIFVVNDSREIVYTTEISAVPPSTPRIVELPAEVPEQADVVPEQAEEPKDEPKAATVDLRTTEEMPEDEDLIVVPVQKKAVEKPPVEPKTADRPRPPSILRKRKASTRVPAASTARTSTPIKRSVPIVTVEEPERTEDVDDPPVEPMEMDEQREPAEEVNEEESTPDQPTSSATPALDPQDAENEEPAAKRRRRTSSTLSPAESTGGNAKTAENEKALSRRLEQMHRCMRGFDDPEVVELWSSIVLETVYNLVKQRLFMHCGKLQTFLSVLGNPKKSGAAKYDELSALLRDTQPELADCIAALMDEEELRPDQEQNPERCAYKCALEMIMNVHIYFNGQQNTGMKRRLLKLIQDLCFTEGELREEMRKLLAGRHEPLWARLRQYFRGEKYTEKVDMSRAEDVPLAVFQAAVSRSPLKRAPTFALSTTGRVDLRFENVDLTSQKPDPAATPLLRQHNGFFSVRTRSGQQVSVNLEVDCAQPFGSPRRLPADQLASSSGGLVFSFTADDDRRLLTSFNEARGSRQRAVDAFLRTTTTNFDENATKRRLAHLLDLFSCISNSNEAALSSANIAVNQTAK